MKIYALHSESSNFLNLADDICQLIPVETFDDVDTLQLGLNDCEGVLLDLDGHQKVVDKLIKNIRKTNSEISVIVLCNSLKDKKLQKHQKSRSAADIYLTYPMDIEILQVMLEESFGSFGEEDTRTIALEVIKEHSEKELSEQAKQASEKLDAIFSSAFFVDYREREAEQMKKTEKENEVNEEIEPIDLDQTVSELDLSIDLSSENENHDDLNLDLGESSDLNVEQKSESGDLDLGEAEELDLASFNEEEIPSTERHEENDGLSLSLDDDNSFSMDLSEQSGIVGDLHASEDEQNVVDPLNIEFGGESELSSDEENEGEEQQEIGLEISISDEQTSASQMFDLGKDEEATFEDEEGIQLGQEEGGLLLSDEDSDDIAEDLGESLSLSDENEDLKDTSELDEFDITRPILESELDAIMSSDDSSALEESDNDLEVADATVADNEDATIMGMSLDEGISNLEDDSLLDNIALNEDGSVEEDNPLEDIKTKMLEIDAMLNGESLKADEEASQAEISIQESLDIIPEESKVIDDVFEDELSVLEEDGGLLLSDEEVDQQPQTEEVKVPKKNVVETATHISQKDINEYRDFQKNHENELIRLGETIRGLREDREKLLGKISTLEEKVNFENTEFLDLKAELDEKKIEIAVVKKRFSKQIDELNIRLDLVSNKKDVLFEQNKLYESEFEKLRKEKKVDLNKVRSRERELEEKLELLKNDAEVQIRNRDHKILDLKRRIDTLEFDIESAHIKERKTVTNQQAIEDKMNKVITTLRSAIGQLEDESSLEERKRLIKKNLDV